jgi:hypothetical protein
MNKELITALNLLEKENGISKEVMFDAIEKSLMNIKHNLIQLRMVELFLTE